MTAVEWLYEQIKFIDKDTYNQLYEQYQQALEMEKQQICKAFDEGWIYGDGYIDKPAKEYYNETYKKDNT
jgi:hypothetical protein